MSNNNKYNAVCPDENELLDFKKGSLSEEDKNLLTEHLLTCDFCLMNLQFMPWESVEHKNTLLAKDIPRKERTSVSESLKKAFDMHRKIRASKPKVEPVNFDDFFKTGKLKVGQIWRTKFDGIVFPSLDGENFYSIPELGSVPHLVVVTNTLDLPEIDNLGKKYQVIKVITIDNNIQYATEGDIKITGNESPLGYDFMLQAWNQRKMLRQNLDAYLGEINFTPQSFLSAVKTSFRELSDYLADLGRKEVSGASYSFIGLIKKGIYSDPIMRYRAREFENTVYLSDPIDNLLEPLVQEIQIMEDSKDRVFQPEKKGLKETLKEVLGGLPQVIFNLRFNLKPQAAFKTVSEPARFETEDKLFALEVYEEENGDKSVHISSKKFELADREVVLSVSEDSKILLQLSPEILKPFDENWVSAEFRISKDQCEKLPENTLLNVELKDKEFDS